MNKSRKGLPTCNSYRVVLYILLCRAKQDTCMLEQLDTLAAVGPFSLVQKSLKHWASTSVRKQAVGPET